MPNFASTLSLTSSALPVGEPVSEVPGDSISEKDVFERASEVPDYSTLERKVVGVDHDNTVLEGELEELLEASDMTPEELEELLEDTLADEVVDI